MGLTRAQLTVNLTWALQKLNGVFAAATQGPASETFSIGTLDLTKWSNIFVEQYTIFVSAPTGLAAALVAGGSLTAATTYYYKVTALADQQETAGSNEASATPSGGNLSIKLTWNLLQGGQTYNIYRGTGAGSENLLVGTITAPTTGTTATFTDTGFAGSSQSPPSAPPSYIEFGLRSFTDLATNAVIAGHALSLFVLPVGTGATCSLTPGSSNGLSWFLSGTTPAYAVPINGNLSHCENPAGTGQALSSGANTMRITNGGSAALTVIVIAICGP